MDEIFFVTFFLGKSTSTLAKLSYQFANLAKVVPLSKEHLGIPINLLPLTLSCSKLIFRVQLWPISKFIHQLCQNKVCLLIDSTDGESEIRKSVKPSNAKIIDYHDPDCQMKSSLFMFNKKAGTWRKVWVILKDSVIYVLKAIEDKKAQSNTPIMGYELEADYQVCYTTFVFKIPNFRSGGGRAV